MDYEKNIKEVLSKSFGIEKEKIMLEKPKNSEFGDYAFPCFSLASVMKKNPGQIAQEISEKLNKTKIKGISKINPAGPYVNFIVNKEDLTNEIISEILKKKDKYAKKKITKEKILTEYCHANTHKAFHIGHTRNICMGESISRIIENQGIKVIRTNYQGDIGMHVAKTLWGMLNLKKLNLKEPNNIKEKGEWLGLVYAKASGASEDEKIKQEINEINQKLYSGDKKLLDLWKKTRKWSIDYFENTVYPDFETKFNRFYFESQVEKKGIEIAKQLLEKNIAKKDQGAIIMDFTNENLGIFILLKTDGTPLYSTKDLYLAELQNKEYNPSKIIHIVGSEQGMYFKQLIKTISLYNSKLAEKEKHLSYELVILPTGKMASREGKVILYDDTLAKLINLIKDEIKKRDVKIKEKELEKRARKIALCAVKYAMLSQSPNKTIVFNEEQITRFEGNTGPYLLYSYARASSIIKKAKQKKTIAKIKLQNLEEKEINLIKKLGEFKEITEQAYKNLDPSIIANYSFELAQTFNEFYHFYPVITSDDKTKQQRLAIVEAFRIILKSALDLIGIGVLEEM